MKNNFVRGVMKLLIYGLGLFGLIFWFQVCTQPVEVVTPNIHLPELIEAPDCGEQIKLLAKAFEAKESWDITEGIAFDTVGCLIEKARIHKENANVCRQQVEEANK